YQALTNAANAINTFATAITNGEPKKNLLTIKAVYEIEISIITEMTTILEVMIDPPILHRDPLTLPLSLL
ncbi:24051_t:CDS:2, partial [Gigaspora margarita]